MHIKKIVLFLIILFSLFCLYTQESYLQEELVQTFEWPLDEYVLYYDIEIEQFEPTKKTYTNIEKQRIKQNHFSISLGIGKYRYRVTTYDLLGRQFNISEWDEVEIKKLVVPKILEVENNLDLPIGNEVLSIEMECLGITEDSKVELVRNDDTVITQGDVVTNASEEKITASFEVNNLESGNYFIRVTNPGILTTESELIEISEPPDMPQLRIVESRDVTVKDTEEQNQVEEEIPQEIVLVKTEENSVVIGEPVKAIDKIPLRESPYTDQMIAQILKKIDELILKAQKEENKDEVSIAQELEEVVEVVEAPKPVLKQTMFYFSGGPQLQIPLFGIQYSMLSTNQLLYGMNAKYGWITDKKDFSLGCEIGISYDFAFLQDTSYSAYLDSFILNLSLLFQKRLNNLFAMNTQVGITSLTNGIYWSENTTSNENNVSGSFGFLVGLSVDYSLTDILILRFGCYYDHILRPSNQLGFLIPFIEIGCFF